MSRMTNFMNISSDTLTPASSGTMAAAGSAADRAAARHVFTDYRARKSANTIRRHNDELVLLTRFLAEIGIVAGDLATDPDAWRGMTWGLVMAFQQWLLNKGYAVSSVNVRVSTIKSYAKLAFKAGALDQSTHALIQTVEGYSRKEQKRVDEGREITRIGSKKANALVLSPGQVATLKQQPNTPTGRRDALLLCILLDHGLRCGETALLQVEHFDQSRGTFTFYRA
jgi:integrase